MWLEKKWFVRDIDPKAALVLAKAAGVSGAVAKILLGRGITRPREVKAFLHGAAQPFYDPFLLKDMGIAVERIAKALGSREKIVIFGDYDVDGITSAALLYLFLREAGASVSYYIPERQSEGYGLSLSALEHLAAGGVSLVVTVDCGISAAAEVANAPNGLDIIITDHHNPPEILPKALAVIDPKQKDCPYPYKELSGVGVAFKLCQGLWQTLSGTQEMWTGYLDIVALGTVADIVPLTGENRELVRRGVKIMQQTENLGLKELVKLSRGQGGKLNTGLIGFSMAPRLNAAGRLTSAEIGVRLLTTEDEAEAAKLAAELDAENCQRQAIEKSILAEAQEMVTAQGGAKSVIVLAKEGWHAGVVGIVASRLVDKYYVPVVMISIGEDYGKGSCRSIDSFDIYGALCATSGCLLQFGGHHQAAGLTIAPDRIDEFRAALEEYAQKNLSPSDYLPVQKIDSQLDSIREIDDKLLAELDQLEPYGMGNPHPVLALKGAAIAEPTAIGAESEHLKFAVKENGAQISAIMWRNGSYSTALYDGVKADIAFVPEINNYRGVKEVRLRITDIMQTHLLADLRVNSGTPLKECLQSILQTGKKTVIYYNSSEKALPDSHLAICLPFGQLPEEEAMQAVFWQPPYTVMDDKLWWAGLKAKGIKHLYLLYDRNDFSAQLAQINAACPAPGTLRDVYRLVRASQPVKLEKLREAFKIPEQTAMCVDILKEIGALTEKDGLLRLEDVANGTRLELSASHQYCAMQEAEKKQKNALDRCMNASRKEFAQMLFA